MSDVKGKIALVTGSSRGIGRSVALALAKAGAHVVINYRTRERDARDVEAVLRQRGARCLCIQADVSVTADVERLVSAAEDGLGSIDILVNNAGVARVQGIDVVTEQDWNDLFRVNVTSCFLVTQRVLPSMRANKWGRIINLSSVAAQVGGVVGPHYAASKAALHGLTHYYAAHLAKEGITANAIAPALIETEMVTSNPNATSDRIPVGRFGAPDEVAEVAVLLASNGYITGQTISVNGGWFMT